MKGQKTGGRTQGTPNKLTKELRSVLRNAIYQELEDLPSYLDKLEPKERLDVVVKLVPYVLPKIEGVHYSEGESAWDVLY